MRIETSADTGTDSKLESDECKVRDGT